MVFNLRLMLRWKILIERTAKCRIDKLYSSAYAKYRLINLNSFFKNIWNKSFSILYSSNNAAVILFCFEIKPLKIFVISIGPFVYDHFAHPPKKEAFHQ